MEGKLPLLDMKREMPITVVGKINPTPLDDWKGHPTFGKSKKAEEGKIAQGLTLTPLYRGGEAHNSPKEESLLEQSRDDH